MYLSRGPTSLPEIRVISFTRYFMPAVLSNIYRACSVASDCQNKMAHSERLKQIEYAALNNLLSLDLQPVIKRKRKFKPGVKLYEAERLISKQKSANEVGISWSSKLS